MAHSSPDGQRALDNSISISGDSHNRIAVDGKEIVELKQTRPGVYHGHTVNWRDLHQTKRNVLIKHKLVKPNGKII